MLICIIILSHIRIKSMKLIIQIPCYNEEVALPVTLSKLPIKINGIDEIEVLVIDDGSTDRTVEIAKSYNVKHILTSTHHRGLARTFMAGLQKAISEGADIIVNVPSGFRAFSRDAAMSINVFDNYTYTIETVIQSKTKGLHIQSVPIRVNSCFRKSRLVKNMFTYIQKNSFTILRMFIIYRPFRFFAIIGGIILFSGLFLMGRFLLYYFLGSGNGHIQSLIISSILLITGFQTCVFGVLADLLAINRKLIEDIQIRTKKLENK